MKEKNIEEIFDEFNKEFDAKIENRREKTPILINIFQQFSDQIYRNSELLQKGVNQKLEIVKAMKLNQEQEKMIEKYNELEYLILDDMIERAFIYGYSVAEKVKEELNKTLEI